MLEDKIGVVFFSCFVLWKRVRGTKAMNMQQFCVYVFFSFLFLSLFAYNNWGRDKKGEENEEKNVSNCIPAYNNVLKYHILCFCKTFPCLLYNFMQEQQQVHMFGIGFYVGAIISLVRCFPFVSFFFSTLIVQCSFLYLFRLETNVFAHTYNLINNIDNGAASASECHLMFNQSASL